MKLLFVLFNLIMGLLTIPLFIFTIIMFQGLSLFVSTTPTYHKILAVIAVLIYSIILFYVNRIIFRKMSINFILYSLIAAVIYLISAISAFTIFYKTV